MSSERQSSAPVLFVEGPDNFKVAYDRYLDHELAPDGDPEKPPKKAPRDWWLRIGILAGAVAGGTTGAVIGNSYQAQSQSNGSTLLLGPGMGGRGDPNYHRRGLRRHRRLDTRRDGQALFES